MNTIYNAVPVNATITQLSGSKSLFKKQLIRFGDWIDPIFPEEVMRIDRVFLETMLRNFRDGVVGRIPVPVTHTDNPEFNRGELVDLVIEGDGTLESDGLYGVLEIRKEETASDIRDGLIFDVSISFTDNYQDNENGALYGPTLLHVALVNNPYIKKMGSFTSLADDLKRLFGSKVQYRMLSESATKKETSMSKVKNDKDFPVEVTYTKDGKEVTETLQPGQELEVEQDQADAVEAAVAGAEAPDTAEAKAAREAKEAEDAAKAKEELENAEKGDQDEDGSTQLSESDKTKRELAEAKAEIRRRDIESTYDTALKDGKIVPAQKDAFIALSEALHGQTRSLSDGKTENLSELLAEFVSKGPKIVSLDEENGKIVSDSDKGPLSKLSEESKQGLAKMRVSEEDYVKYGSRENISVNELVGAENG